MPPATLWRAWARVCMRVRVHVRAPYYMMRQCLEGCVLSGQLVRRRRKLQQCGVVL